LFEKQAKEKIFGIFTCDGVVEDFQYQARKYDGGQIWLSMPRTPCRKAAGCELKPSASISMTPMRSR
jgi:hypothetical protein